MALPSSSLRQTEIDSYSAAYASGTERAGAMPHSHVYPYSYTVIDELVYYYRIHAPGLNTPQTSPLE